MKPIDVTANRNQSKWSTFDKLYRVFWALAYVFFRLSPRPLWGTRVNLLRLFGAQVGENVHIYPTVKIFMPKNLIIGDNSSLGDQVEVYNLGTLTIGKDTTVSQHAYICGGTHAIDKPTRDLIKSSVTIGDNVWICAKALIGPDVVVSSNSIVGAGAVLVKNATVPGLYAGNPALLRKEYE